MPEPIATLLDVYGAHAEALRFPEIDHETLHAQAERLREAAAEVDRCERALAAARQGLHEHQQALIARAERGLAYARIFAQDDPELLERLAAVELRERRAPGKKAGKKAPPRRATRTRRRKGDGDESVTELPFAGEEAAVACACCCKRCR